VDKISLGMALELVEGIDWGARTPKIPSGEAKDRYEGIAVCGWIEVFRGSRQAESSSFPK
jgi:hypothetical protein